MEMDDLKSEWKKLETSYHDQDIFESEQVRKTIRQKYRSKMRRVLFPEIVGMLIALYFAALFFFHFSMLDTQFLQVEGIITIVLLLIVPGSRIYLLSRLYQSSNMAVPFQEAYAHFLRYKIKFQKMQMVNSALMFLLIISVIVLCTRIYNEYDVTSNKYFWAVTFSLSMLFVLFFEYKIKKGYLRLIRQAEDLLRELY